MDRVYLPTECVWFHSKQDANWLMSNMAGGMPIYWPPRNQLNHRWHSTEQLFQAAKYPTSAMCVPASSPEADPCVRNRIRSAPGPRAAKMTQRCAVKSGLVRTDWPLVRCDVMQWILELKAYWNQSTFARQLAATGSQPLVEVSRKDAYWGTVRQPDGLLVGQNQLGLALMAVRDRLPQVLAGKFTFGGGFLLD